MISNYCLARTPRHWRHTWNTSAQLLTNRRRDSFVLSTRPQEDYRKSKKFTFRGKGPPNRAFMRSSAVCIGGRLSSNGAAERAVFPGREGLFAAPMGCGEAIRGCELDWGAGA